MLLLILSTGSPTVRRKGRLAAAAEKHRWQCWALLLLLLSILVAKSFQTDQACPKKTQNS